MRTDAHLVTDPRRCHLSLLVGRRAHCPSTMCCPARGRCRGLSPVTHTARASSTTIVAQRTALTGLLRSQKSYSLSGINSTSQASRRIERPRSLTLTRYRARRSQADGVDRTTLGSDPRWHGWRRQEAGDRRHSSVCSSSDLVARRPRRTGVGGQPRTMHGMRLSYPQGAAAMVDRRTGWWHTDIGKPCRPPPLPILPTHIPAGRAAGWAIAGQDRRASQHVRLFEAHPFLF